MIDSIIIGVTIAVAIVLGMILNATWDAGYWYLVVLFTPTIIAIAYRLSPPQERQQFIVDLKHAWNRLWRRR